MDYLNPHIIWLESPYSCDDALGWMQKAVSEGPQYYEWLNKRANGDYFWEKVHLATIILNKEKRILATTVDITHQKKAEADLTRHEEQFRRIIESLPLSLTIATMEGVVLYANPKGLEFFERDSTIFGQKKAFTVWVNPQDREKWIHDIRQNGIINNFEMQLQTESGRKLWAIGSGLIINYQGQDCILSVQQDITYRKMMEEAIAESEEKFRILAENASAGIYLAFNNKFIYVNNGLSEMLAYTPEEMIETDFIRYIHPDHRKIVAERAKARQLGDEVPNRYEIKLLTKNSDTRWVELNAAMTSLKGRRINLGTIFDITDRYQATQALFHTNRKLESAMHQLKEAQQKVVKQERLTAVGQVSAGIAHDFNNILSSILGFAELLEYRAFDPQMQSHVRHIKTAGKRAAKLVQQLLDFTSKGLRTPQTLDLIRFIEKSKADIAELFPQNLKIEYQMPDEAYMIEADPDQLQQIINNISLNAAHAMQAEGKFKISLAKENLTGNTYCVICNETFKGEYFHISFQDNGSGISAINLPHIFDPFFTTKEVGKGSGLGLSQVFGIVSQYDGHLSVESELGVGTTFHLYWPPEKSTVHRDANQTHKKSDDGRWS